ncbi:MAG: hypothetical protein QF645_07315 [Planctomycetota bacterium]|nr:hypothetical protein [Planctomycetota bacterium]
MGTISFLVLMALGIFMGGFLILITFLLKKSNQATKRSPRRTAPTLPGKTRSIESRKDKNAETEPLMKDFWDFHAEETQKENPGDRLPEVMKNEKAIISSCIDYERTRLGYQLGVWKKKEEILLATEESSKLLPFLKKKEMDLVEQKARMHRQCRGIDSEEFPPFRPDSINAMRKEIVTLEQEFDLLIEATQKQIRNHTQGSA